MGEHHDGNSAVWAGWDFWAYLPAAHTNCNMVGRHWVAINGLANPWGP